MSGFRRTLMPSSLSVLAPHLIALPIISPTALLLPCVTI